ncbi:hypothetical protein KCU69_g9652, partial [Aureobasidium melanogenum]
MTASSNSATVVATSAPTSSSPSEPTSDKVRSHNQGDNESAAAKPLRHDHKSVQLQDIANTVYTNGRGHPTNLNKPCQGVAKIVCGLCRGLVCKTCYNVHSAHSSRR